MKIQLTIERESSFPHARFSTASNTADAIRRLAAFLQIAKKQAYDYTKDAEGNEIVGMDSIDKLSYDELVAGLHHSVDAYSIYRNTPDQATLQNITVCLDKVDKVLKEFERDTVKPIMDYIKSLRKDIDTFPTRQFCTGYLVDLMDTFCEFDSSPDCYVFQDKAVAETILQTFGNADSVLYKVNFNFLPKSKTTYIPQDRMWSVQGEDISSIVEC